MITAFGTSKVMPYTTIERCSDIEALRASVAHNLPRLEWRRHGIGALQAYLRERDPEVRVHIWAPELLVPGMEHPRNVHTHRFDLCSTVLYGTLRHTEFAPIPDDYGGFNVYEVTHARIQGKHQLPEQVFDRPVKLASYSHQISAGQTYRYPKHLFHSTAVDSYAITVITKKNQEEKKALILSPLGVQPEHGFTNPLSSTKVAEIVSWAGHLLEGM